MSHTYHVVVVDDDLEVREMLSDYLEGRGHKVFSFASGVEAFQFLQQDDEEKADVVITDLNMPKMDGLEFVQRVQKLRSHLPVIMITAFSSIESAIDATKHGAYAYVVKPFKLGDFEVTLKQAVEKKRLARENKLLRQAVQEGWTHGRLIGKSKSMRELYQLIDRIGHATANVMITGESGTGKELVARSIHDQGVRKNKPFVAINCAAIPDNLLESELFGHIKGAFTGAVTDKPGLFEEADGGTLFLDEIGDLNLMLQAKLLRVLQEKEIKPVGSVKSKKVNVRIISATHRDLRNRVQEKLFRDDLFFRLSVIPVHVPPLRERRQDIPLLANHFLRKYASANNSVVQGFSEEAMAKLLEAPWPGNVRELENLVERTVVLSASEIVKANEIRLPEAQNTNDILGWASDNWPSLAELEKQYIKSVLSSVNGRKEAAAQILGINRRTLYRKGLEYGGLDQ